MPPVTPRNLSGHAQYIFRAYQRAVNELPSGQVDCLKRTVVSRCYYAIFHHARDLAGDQSVNDRIRFDKGDHKKQHERLLEWFEHDPEVHDRLKALLTRRQRADYDIDVDFNGNPVDALNEMKDLWDVIPPAVKSKQ